MDTLINYDNVPVAEIAIHHPSAVSVFNKHQIDFCCGGKLEFRKACEKAGADPEEVLQELIQTEEKSIPGTIRFDSWDTNLLCDFIVQHHHTYVKRAIPIVKELIQRVVEAHGKDRPELSKLQETFNELSEELLQHMNKEELILFPEIKKLLNEIPISTSFPFLPMNIQAPMAMMEDEHTHAGDLIKSIRSMTRNYNPPASACPTYKITYKRLEEFDQDLMQHIHLENNVLFNKVRSKLTAPVL